MVTIGQAAALTGVPEHTLRAWERRYGILQPTRTSSGYRVYGEEALRRIEAMRDLVAEGVPAREASERVRDLAVGSPSDVEATDRLIEALTRLDATEVARIVNRQFAERSYEDAVDDWLMPAMVRVGASWASGEINEAGEHLVANVVMRRLSAAFDAVGANPAVPPVIIGAAPGVTHEVGLLAFAVALRRTGLATVYLGADVPAGAWAEAVTATGAVMSVTTIPRRADLRRVATLVERLRASHPDVPVAVGGRFQHLAPPECVRLGHLVGPAAREIAERVRQQ